MSVAVHAFTTVPIREDLRANRQSGDIILDADGEFDLQFLSVFRQVPGRENFCGCSNVHGYSDTKLF